MVQIVDMGIMQYVITAKMENVHVLKHGFMVKPSVWNMDMKGYKSQMSTDNFFCH